MVVQEFIAGSSSSAASRWASRKSCPSGTTPASANITSSDDTYLSQELRQRIIDDSLTLVRALGYDMNSMEWAVRDGVPYAIDFMNPAPDMDVNSLTPLYFDWAVKQMADMAIRLAKEPRPQRRELRWEPFSPTPDARPGRTAPARHPRRDVRELVANVAAPSQGPAEQRASHATHLCHLAHTSANGGTSQALREAIESYHDLLTEI